MSGSTQHPAWSCSSGTALPGFQIAMHGEYLPQPQALSDYHCQWRDSKAPHSCFATPKNKFAECPECVVKADRTTQTPPAAEMAGLLHCDSHMRSSRKPRTSAVIVKTEKKKVVCYFKSTHNSMICLYLQQRYHIVPAELVEWRFNK